ncbi:MAG: glycosyltransferase family 4 protein [Firmicutes bacterium]|nr:glycosyltransferase family 4 protein [Bacillota bacterium]
MKIALVHSKYTIKGGMERYLVRFSRFLVDEGHEVHVFASSWDKDVDNRIVFHEISNTGKALGIEQYTFAKNAYKEVNKHSFDIIQTFSRVGFGDVIRIGAGCHEVYKERLLKNIDSPVKQFFKKVEYRLSIKDYLTRYLEKQDFKKGNYKKIVAVSSMVKTEILQKYQVPEEDIIVNHNGVDIKMFNPENHKRYRQQIRNKHGIKDDEILLLFVGSGFERKGLKYIIKALDGINKKVKLMVIGRGNINKFKLLAEQNKVEDRVIFIGFTSEINNYYSAGDIFVFPSIYDPCANVTLEAMASALPIITTVNNGASGLVKHGENGFILDNSGEVVNIRLYIKQLMDREKRKRMGVVARNTILNHTEKINHRRMIKIYHTLLN